MRQIKTTATTATKAATALWTMIAALGIAGLASPGCQRYVYAPRGEVKNEPVPIDEAMQIRDWEPSSARYTNPRFIAGPVGYWFQPAYGMPAPVYAVQETPMFVLQTLALPVTVWFPPLWTPIEYAGETLEPTWHAMPLQPEVHYGEPPAPAEDTDRGMQEPAPTPAAPAEPSNLSAPTPPVEDAPARTVAPGAEPMREIPPPSDRPAPSAQPQTVPPPAAPRSVTTPAPAPAAQTTPAPTAQPTPARATQTTPAQAAQPTPAPSARPSTVSTTRPATQPTYTPSSVAPTRGTPATRPTTVPARDLNK